MEEDESNVVVPQPPDHAEWFPVEIEADDDDEVEDSEDGDIPASTVRVLQESEVPNSSGTEENVDGLCCPICLESWTNAGTHQLCCLPCGHMYGLSCIKRWLQLRRSSQKCPQCNRKCSFNDVIVLYASRISVDEKSQKNVLSLEAKCTSLEKKNRDWCKKELQWQKMEADVKQEVCQLKEYLEARMVKVEAEARELKARVVELEAKITRLESGNG